MHAFENFIMKGKENFFDYAFWKIENFILAEIQLMSSKKERKEEN